MRLARLGMLLALLGVASPAFADTKVAVVDVQHALLATEDGIRAQATLKKLFDKRQQDLDAKQAELQKMHEDIEKQSRFLSREALQKRMEDWQRRLIDTQNVYVQFQQELAKRQNELQAPIEKKLFRVIERIAHKNNVDIIVNKGAAPYCRQDLDLTEQVVQMYNTGESGDSADEKKPEK